MIRLVTINIVAENYFTRPIAFRNSRIMIIPNLSFPSAIELAAWKSISSGANVWALKIPSFRILVDFWWEWSWPSRSEAICVRRHHYWLWLFKGRMGVEFLSKWVSMPVSKTLRTAWAQLSWPVVLALDPGWSVARSSLAWGRPISMSGLNFELGHKWRTVL